MTLYHMLPNVDKFWSISLDKKTCSESAPKQLHYGLGSGAGT